MDNLRHLLETCGIADAPSLVRRHELARVSLRSGRVLPIEALVIGTEDRHAPTLGLFGGIHGIERIGAQTAVSYLHSLVELLRWDIHARRRFAHCRLVAIPLVNPGGALLRRRSNPNGVDLMRNAPVQAVSRPPPLLGGHRLSPRLPWFRGREGAPMETEARALCDFVRAEVFDAPVAITIDLHSGFGARDRLWYPYARQRHGFPRAAAALRLATLLDRTFPNHIYKVEPQAASYTTHGDLWDHLFDEHWATRGKQGNVFIPWTLEMGSWLWVRKNPRQLLSWAGSFNPGPPHRHKRVLRRHIILIDFMLRAVDNPGAWVVPADLVDD